MLQRCASAILFLVLTASISNASIETFDTETNGSTSFSEGGRTFSTSGDLIVEVDSNLGSGGSAGWLGTQYIGNPVSNNIATPTTGSAGSITIDAGWSFEVNSFDAWTGANDGDFEQHGSVKFIGTLVDSTTAEATLDIDQNTLLDFQMGLNFSGTALDGVALTSLEFELVGEIGGKTNALSSGVLDYLAVDNLDFTAVQIQTAAVPESSTFAIWGGLLSLVAIGWRRKGKAVTRVAV